MTDDTTITVTRLIDASASEIFDVLTNPQRHPETDASGRVVSDEKGQRIKAQGDVFRMNMRYEDKGGHVTEYQTDNHVTGCVPNKLVAWKPGLVDEKEPLGWEWLYELTPQGPDATEVSLTYDWSDAPQEAVNEYGVPNFTADDLQASLGQLASAVAG